MRAIDLEVDLDVFRKYAGLALPRHVAYPMPTWWSDIDADQAAAMLRESRRRKPANELSLYLHIPFCEKICRYCACTRVALPKKAPQSEERTDAYVAALRAEIVGLTEVLGRKQRVRQIHWGGGTPTSLSSDRLERAHQAITEHFDVVGDAEVAIELDPRVTTDQMLQTLRRLGFTRASFGVQDFNLDVQEHVGRVQPFELVREMVTRCRELGFASVNFDLIYGLPLQTPDTIRRTLEHTLELSPDRIAYYHFAQIPDKVAAQRGLDYTRLPDSETKLEMFLIGLRMLTAGGYQFIGLDHFAKPDEALAVALRKGTLQRNFQGMTTGGGLDLIGIGASSISHLAGLGFLQNVRELREYLTCTGDGRTPIFRGKRFTADDRIRQGVLADLYCRGEIQPERIEQQYDIVFADYFARELGIMRELEEDGLVSVEEDGRIVATMPLGRVLMRTVAGVFDAYLEPDAYRAGDRQYFSANA
jgi:oxygen-independent coproporphyrinogen-3 oxidase